MEVILNFSKTQQFSIKCSQNKKSNALIFKELSLSTSKFIKKSQNKLIIKSSFWKVVPNVIRYKFRFKNNSFAQIPIVNTVNKKSNYHDEPFKVNDCRSVIIVLESPHINEYTPNMQPISPAQGITGAKINSNIKELLQTINNHVSFKQNEIIEISLVNPIPLQTSLGMIHKKPFKGKYSTLRNNVWKCIWENTNYKRDFINLISLLDSKDIIINSCTKNLKKHIQQALSNGSNQSKNIFNSVHPSSHKNWVSTLEKI